MTPAARALPVALLATAIIFLSQSAAQHQPVGATMLSWIRLISVDSSNYTCEALKQQNILTYRQAEWCQTESTYMKYIFDAANVFVRECETTFMKHKWNCSTVRYYPTDDLVSVTREQAVVSAFAAGVMIEQLVKGIRADNLPDSCLVKKGKKDRRQKKFVCEKDYLKADELASSFLGIVQTQKKKDIAKGIIALPIQYSFQGKRNTSYPGERRVDYLVKQQQYVIAHNYMIGIKVIHEVKFEKCPPLGQYKCYYHVPDDRLREHYRERYTRAMRVALIRSNKHYALTPHRYSSSQHTDTCKDSLVFLTASHDYCDYMMDDISGLLQSLGTYYRECDPHRDVTNKCETFCCNRGFHSQNFTECYGLQCPTAGKYDQCTCSETKNVTRHYCNGPPRSRS